MIRVDQLELTNGKIITFNSQQIEALDKISKWLKSDQLYMTLAGVAGSGKTTVTKKIIEICNIKRSSISVSAPTHQAKKMVSRMSGLDGITTQSMLGLRPDIDLSDFNPNAPQFNPIALPKINEYKLIFLDEASMVNEQLFKLIKNINSKYRVKILFIGDPCQINPIGEERSVVFSDENIEVFWLTTVIRQQDSNPLMSIYDSLRNNLDDLYGGFERVSNMNDKGEGIIFTNSKKIFRQAVIETFTSEEARNNIEYVKLIAWTNDAVMKSNQTIRTAIFGENSDIVEVNDTLLGYRSISDETGKFNIIDNSANYRVIKKSGLEENQYRINGYRLTLSEKIDEETFVKTNIFLVDSKDHDNLHEYAIMHDLLRDNAKNNKKLWKKYYEFRRKTMICVNINTFKNGIKRGGGDVIKRDIDYGYSITGHRSQGSTYTKIFMLEDNMNLNSNINERNRIKYVALSRPTTSAYVLSSIVD